MLMNPTTMNDIAKKYWELTHGEILTQIDVSLRNGGGGGGRVDGGRVAVVAVTSLARMVFEFMVCLVGLDPRHKTCYVVVISKQT